MHDDWIEAMRKNRRILITETRRNLLRETEDLVVAKVIAVDHFDPDVRSTLRIRQDLWRPTGGKGSRVASVSIFSENMDSKHAGSRMTEAPEPQALMLHGRF